MPQKKLHSLLLAYTLVIVSLVGLLGVFSHLSLGGVLDASQVEHRVTDVVLTKVREGRYHVVQIQQFISDVAATGEPGGFEPAEQHYRAALAALGKLEELAPARSADFAALRSQLADYYQVGRKMGDAYLSGGRESGNRIMQEATTGFDARADSLTSHLEDIERWAEGVSVESTQATESTIVQLRNTILGLSGLMAALVLGGGWLVGRRVLGLLGGEPVEAARVVSLIAAGDLSQPLTSTDKQSLMGQLETMRQQLSAEMQQLSTGAQELASYAETLAAVSQHVATGAEHGSMAAARTAASVEEMTASIGHVSENAVSASRAVAQSGDDARTGSEIILALAQNMATVSQSVKSSADMVTDLGRKSEEISSVIGFIKEIADQTNLLALNAAIEAARAGETGRGFAVVADEVRKLAERTAVSAEEIRTKIQSVQSNVQSVVGTMTRSVAEVARGEKLAGDADAAIRSIYSSTADAVVMVRDISSAIQENSQASVEMSKTVEYIASVSEENNNAAKEVAATASNMTALASRLSGLAGAFKTA